MTTDHMMVLACLRGSGALHNLRYQRGRTTWIIATPTGVGVVEGGHQVPRPPAGGHDAQDSREEEGVLDIIGHMALGGSKDCLTPDPPRGPTCPTHSNHMFQSINSREMLPSGKYSMEGG